MKKLNLVFLFIMVTSLLSCDFILRPYHELPLRFYGEYKGVYYQTKGGDIVYFDSLNTPVLLYVSGLPQQIKVTIGNEVEEHLTEVWMDVDKSKRGNRNVRLVMNGLDKNGTQKSIRMYNTDNPKSAEFQILVSNFILGDYHKSKDTVDIFYKYVGNGMPVKD